MTEPRRARERRGAAVAAVAVGLLAAALLLPGLGQRVLSNNDEARFAVLGQHVLASGRWWRPELDGALYHNKPPLQAWLIALVSWPAGRVTQLTAVLPSAAAAIATALVVHALGRAMLGAAGGAAAALVAVTTQGFLAHAGVPMPDMLLTAAVTASVAALWAMASGAPGPWWLACYGAMAVAFWAKGPAGLLPLGVALAWGLASPDPGRWRALRLPAGLGLLALAIAPWLLRGFAADAPGAGRALVVDQLLWYAGGRPAASAVAGPLANTFGILFPWVLALPVAAVAAWRAARAPGSGAAPRFLLVWLAAAVTLAALSAQQRVRYYLPALAPGALLVAWWLAGRWRAAPERGWRGTAGVAAAVALAAAALGAWLGPAVGAALEPGPGLWPGHAALLAAGLVLFACGLLPGLPGRGPRAAFAIACAGAALWTGALGRAEAARRHAAADWARLGAAARHARPDRPVVAAWGVPHLPLTFYLARPVAGVESPGQLAGVLARHPGGSALVTGRAIRELDAASLDVVELPDARRDGVVLVSPRRARPGAAAAARP